MADGLYFRRIDELRHEVDSYVRWYNGERMCSTLGNMSPVEFRETGSSL
ncbi:MAG: IS3 family transposase [Coriobacteriaceae bacterium]|nr:IS3 family transposase [Coriobacteriaceae bacterium]